ncbi:unnamed protein product [Rhodiola kirilowii]
MFHFDIQSIIFNYLFHAVMGANCQGYGENIPPDSWLVCEVELISTR